MHADQLRRILDEMEEYKDIFFYLNILRVANFILTVLACIALLAAAIAFVIAMGTMGSTIWPTFLAMILALIALLSKIVLKAITKRINNVNQKKLKRIIAELKSKIPPLRVAFDNLSIEEE